jgi:transcriptional regulator with XRE-family HTH domain
MTVETPAAPEATEGAAPVRVARRPHWAHVGPRLKALREEANLSQKAFAALTKQVDPKGKGITGYSITRHEQAIHAPRPSAVHLFTAALTHALGRRITEDDLRMRGREGLSSYLETIRESQNRTRLDFYERGLGIPVDRALALLAGHQEWTVDELRRIHRKYTESMALLLSVIADDAVTVQEEAA